MELEDMSEDDDRAPPLDLGGDNIIESANKLRNCTGCSSAGVGGSSSMANILENVLENVLHFLTSCRDRNAASLVCKSWYRVEALTRPHLFIGNCYAVSPSRAVSRFNRIKSAAIKGKPRFADFNLMPDGWGAHFTPWVTTLAKAYPWLEKVYLKRMSMTDENVLLLARSCPDLKELVVVCCDGFSTSGLTYIGR